MNEPRHIQPSLIKNKTGFVLGIVCFLVFLLLPLGPEPPARRTFGLMLLCAIWWGTEAISIYATALLPGLLLPLLGILPLQEAFNQYADRLVFLFLGGFFIARSMVKWKLDRRIALNVLSRAGTNPRLLMLYFMIATAVLSAFISNTATTAMMLPIGMSMLLNVRMKDKMYYGKALMLGIAYAATIGGAATLVGTPPNVVFASYAGSLLGKEIAFFDWLKIGLPYSIVMLPLAWKFLLLKHKPEILNFADENLLTAQIKKLGPLNRGQKATIFVFLLVAFLWMTRSFWDRLPFEAAKTIQNRVDDSIIALLGALLLFMIPLDLRKWHFPLEWKDTREIPWGIIILFAGGLCLGKGLFESGAAEWIAKAAPLTARMHPLFLMLIVLVITSFISELASNTAVANMMLPILAAIAASLGLSGYLLMIPAALACSNVFMLPISTPPNAIVYSSGYIHMQDMIKKGFTIHLIGIMVMLLVCYFIIGKIFGIIPL